MAFALVVLAVGSVLAGYVGLPYVMGPNLLAEWLGPVFAGAMVPEVPHDTAAEIMLMAVATLIAIAGIGTAWFIWLNRRDIADSTARSAAPIYRLLLNKYYVDEAYDAAIVHPVHRVSEEGLWRGFDVKVIDGAVNGTAAFVAGSSMVLRRLQTGSVKAYAGSVVIGTVVILGYSLWR
jgi:NADH-quinone oxidoreductase subunit L